MKIPVSSDLHAFCLFFDSYYLSRTPWCEVFIGRSLGKTKWQKLFEKCCLTRTKPKADVERSRFNVLVATGPHWTWADYLQTMGLKSGNKNLNLSHHVECAHVGNFQPFINFWFNHVPGWKHHMFECFCGGFFSSYNCEVLWIEFWGLVCKLYTSCVFFRLASFHYSNLGFCQPKGLTYWSKIKDQTLTTCIRVWIICYPTSGATWPRS